MLQKCEETMNAIYGCICEGKLSSCITFNMRQRLPARPVLYNDCDMQYEKVRERPRSTANAEHSHAEPGDGPGAPGPHLRD